jgi:acetylornithine aminotransferase/acetylornithine/N-succinyldiaminopimelate aminotransferase
MTTKADLTVPAIVRPVSGSASAAAEIRTDAVQALEARHVLQTYRRAPVTFVRGHGVRLFDSDGREYIDLLSGIGVAALGHAHPGLTQAIADQAGTLLHTSNLFFHPLQGRLAERLSAFSGLQRAFFCNSGTEAVEACLKFVRRYWHTLGEPRAEFIALEESFHGRTLGALSVTSDEHYRTPFEPLVPGVRFVPVNDPAALLAAVSTRTGAIIAESVQGEGGVRPLTPEFAAAIAEACRKTNALFIADEVQSGLGRTGHPFYFQALGLSPDLVAVGKALGSGVPVGAALINERVASTISFGDHGTTYGGNLLACRAALYVMEQLMDGGLVAHINSVGAHMEARLRVMAAAHPLIKEVRGMGLIWGLDLHREAGPIVPAGLSHGVVVNRTADTVVRLLPPMIITTEEIDEGLRRLDAALATVEAGAAA